MRQLLAHYKETGDFVKGLRRVSTVSFSKACVAADRVLQSFKSNGSPASSQMYVDVIKAEGQSGEFSKAYATYEQALKV